MVQGVTGSASPPDKQDPTPHVAKPAAVAAPVTTAHAASDLHQTGHTAGKATTLVPLSPPGVSLQTIASLNKQDDVPIVLQEGATNCIGGTKVVDSQGHPWLGQSVYVSDTPSSISLSNEKGQPIDPSSVGLAGLEKHFHRDIAAAHQKDMRGTVIAGGLFASGSAVSHYFKYKQSALAGSNTIRVAIGVTTAIDGYTVFNDVQTARANQKDGGLAPSDYVHLTCSIASLASDGMMLSSNPKAFATGVVVHLAGSLGYLVGSAVEVASETK